MAGGAGWGVGQGVDGREAGQRAFQAALASLGRIEPVLGCVWVSQEISAHEALEGITALSGDLPLWGFTSICPFTGEGEKQHSVVVGLVSAPDAKVQSAWFPPASSPNLTLGHQIVQALRYEPLPQRGALVALDGSVGGDLNGLQEILDGNPWKIIDPDEEKVGKPPVIAGALSIQDPRFGPSWQLIRNQTAQNSLAALCVGGSLSLAQGYGHGWQEVGLHYRVTRVESTRLIELDGQRPLDVFANVFGYPAAAWFDLPLRNLVRLYPLGVERSIEDLDWSMRSVVQVKPDGSFLLNGPVAEGDVVHLMVGDPNVCLQAARKAVADARRALNQVRPLLAVVFLDLSWRYLFQTRPDEVFRAIQKELGEIPVVGAYTGGQILGASPAGAARLLNQNVFICLIGEDV